MERFYYDPPKGEGRTSIIPVLLKHQHHKGLYNMPTKATARHFSTQLLDTKIKGGVGPVLGWGRCGKTLCEVCRFAEATQPAPKKIHHFEMATIMTTRTSLLCYTLHRACSVIRHHFPSHLCNSCDASGCIIQSQGSWDSLCTMQLMILYSASWFKSVLKV